MALEQTPDDPFTSLCADPAYAGSDFCKYRLPGETPAQFNARQLSNPLTVVVTRGQQVGDSGAMWFGVAALVAVWVLFSGHKD